MVLFLLRIPQKINNAQVAGYKDLRMMSITTKRDWCVHSPAGLEDAQSEGFESGSSLVGIFPSAMLG